MFVRGVVFAPSASYLEGPSSEFQTGDLYTQSDIVGYERFGYLDAWVVFSYNYNFVESKVDNTDKCLL
jgi:hypothetical protein